MYNEVKDRNKHKLTNFSQNLQFINITHYYCYFKKGIDTPLSEKLGKICRK